MMTQEQPELLDYIGLNDLLSRVLEAPKYNDRVRGTGFAATQTSYFRSQKRPNKNDFQQLKEKVSGYKCNIPKFTQGLNVYNRW